MKTGNTGRYFYLTGQLFVTIEMIVVKNKILQNRIKTNSPTGSSGATTLPLIGDSFMYRNII